MIRLVVPRLEALGASQLKLEGGAVKDAAIDELADRLATRLGRGRVRRLRPADTHIPEQAQRERSEEHTSELQSLMRNSYAVFCLKKKKTTHTQTHNTI